MTSLLLALVLQGQLLDDGTLVVRQDTLEVAREAFKLVSGRIGTGRVGWTLSSTVRYDRVRPVITLAPILEVCCDTLPFALQYDVADPREPVRILGEFRGGRFTVRLLSRSTERAREFPANGSTVVLDDSVFAFYVFVVWRATPEPLRLTAILPRGLRREQIVVQDRGTEATAVNRDAVTLRHVTVSGGANELVHVWVDPAGRLMKVEIPSRNLTAERAAGP
ncbi:MAG TPA: hypothetical protein VGA20_01950 [Gemmatimonadales bacterium]